MRSSLPEKMLSICRSLSKRSMLLLMLSMGRRVVGQNLTSIPNSNCNSLGETLPIVRSWMARLVGRQKKNHFSIVVRMMSAFCFANHPSSGSKP